MDILHSIAIVYFEYSAINRSFVFLGGRLFIWGAPDDRRSINSTSPINLLNFVQFHLWLFYHRCHWLQTTSNFNIIHQHIFGRMQNMHKKRLHTEASQSNSKSLNQSKRNVVINEWYHFFSIEVILYSDFQNLIATSIPCPSVKS